MSEHVPNRRTTEKLMLARGFSWDSIQDALELTYRQLYNDKKAIELEKKKTIVEEDPKEYFKDYVDVAKQTMEDLQRAHQSADSSAASVTALKAKEEIARNIINVAQQTGVLPKAVPDNNFQGNTINILNIDSKSELVDLLTKRLTGKE